jgi:hypothetical protein
LAGQSHRRADLRVAADSSGEGRIFVLDAETFAEAAADPDAAEHLAKPFAGGTVELGPYAVASLKLR